MAFRRTAAEAERGGLEGAARSAEHLIASAADILFYFSREMIRQLSYPNKRVPRPDIRLERPAPPTMRPLPGGQPPNRVLAAHARRGAELVEKCALVFLVRQLPVPPS